MNRPHVVGWMLLALLFAPALLPAQVLVVDPSRPIVVPPHTRPAPIAADYKIRAVEIQTAIRDQLAKVQISQVFQNTSSRELEASLFFPIPEGASISGLTLLVDGKELTGKLLSKADARRIYEEIVSRRRDPALLEYVGQGLFQTSVFPVPANAERKVEIRYTQLLRKDAGLVDLLIPLGTNKHSSKPIESLELSVRLETSEAIKTVYSPSHKVDFERPDDKHAVCKLSLKQVQSPDDFRLLYGTQAGAVGVNLLSYRPSDKEDGYFLLLAAPELQASAAEAVGKTVLFVVDRSGSMSGPKIVQAKEALKYVLGQLKPADTFNIVAYDSAVESFRPELQKADAATVQAATGFVDGLFAGGGTNIDGALQTALKLLGDKSRPSYVLFLTDGLPTVAEVNEMSIAKNALQANAVGARMFTFGVGFDVNSRLLDRLSHEGRGQSQFVRPNESIEMHVSALYAKIGAPVMTDIAVNVEFDAPRDASAPPAIARTYPRQLTDLFQGEQFVWVGRYNGQGPVKVTLTGMLAGEKQTFTFPAALASTSADETNGFVEKLWATRRIGEIIDELDLKGHNKELVDELVQLSMKHGIMTPYTSFLADERTDLAAGSANRARAAQHVSDGLSESAGRLGFAQRDYKRQLQMNPHVKLDSAVPALTRAPAAPGASVAPEAIPTAEQNGVRNVGQKTFFRRNNQWRDASVTTEQEKKAIRVTQFSPEYFELASRHGGKLAKYVAFEEPVLVNLDDQTYQIDPPK